MANPPKERREFTRYDTDVTAIVSNSAMRIATRMLSVSASGALIRLDRLSAKVFDTDTFILEIHGVGRFSATKIWRRDTDFGVRFDLSGNDRLKLAERLAERFGRPRSYFRGLATTSPQP